MDGTLVSTRWFVWLRKSRQIWPLPAGSLLDFEEARAIPRQTSQQMLKPPPHDGSAFSRKHQPSVRVRLHRSARAFLSVGCAHWRTGELISSCPYSFTLDTARSFLLSHQNNPGSPAQWIITVTISSSVRLSRSGGTTR